MRPAPIPDTAMTAGGTVWVAFYGRQIVPFCLDVIDKDGQ